MIDFYPNVYEDRGFLFRPDPFESLPASSIFSYLDGLADSLPEYVRRGTVRTELSKLPKYGYKYSILSSFHERGVLNRLRMLYAYFAHAYVHGQEGFNGVIPASISKPLCELSEIVKRPPVLSYADYALNNWKKIDYNKGIEIDNLRLLQYFHGIKDEAWFILIHVDIEAKAGLLLKNLYNLTEYIFSGKPYDDLFFCNSLIAIRDTFKAINSVMARMPENCSPDVYFEKVRPYIFGLEKVIYEGVDRCSFFSNTSKDQTFRGETGAQSSIVPAVLAGLGIRHKNSILTSHLKDMRRYMPTSHRNFIAHLEESVSVREYLSKGNVSGSSVTLFNQVLDELVVFRKTHLSYAIDYIEKKCDNPTGTGGTPYIKWLSELIDETKLHYLKVK